MEPTYIDLPNNRFVKLGVEVDKDPSNPRTEWDNVGVMVCFHNRYSLGDEGHGLTSDMFNSWDELRDHLLKKCNAAVVLPIYMYDHSGITISTKPFGDKWDSGQVGLIYATQQKVAEEFGGECNLEAVERATTCLEGEVETYDQYLRGDVYGYIVKVYERTEAANPDDHDTDEAEVLDEDSCWGFFGEECCEEEGKAVADRYAEIYSASV